MKSSLIVAGATILTLLHTSCGGLPDGPQPSTTGPWSTVMVASHDVPSGWAQGFLSATLTDSGLIVVGLLRPLEPDAATKIHPLTIDHFDYSFVERPSAPRTSSFPRVIRASGDQFFLFWGESEDSGSIEVWEAQLSPAKKIRYAQYSPTVGWSDPVTLIEGYERVDWIPGAGSIVTAAEGEVHLALAAGHVESDILHVTLPREGDARVHRIPTTIASPYTAIDVQGDSVLIAYAASHPTEPRPNFQVHIVRSLDGGRSWEEPYLLEHARVTGGTYVRLARTPDDHLHLLIGEPAGAGSPWTQGFIHMSSEDWGENWVFRGSIDTPIGVQKPQLTADRNGRLHFAVRDTRPPVSRILYAEWHDGRWSETLDPLPHSTAGSFALLNDGETVHLVMNYWWDDPDNTARVWLKRN